MRNKLGYHSQNRAAKRALLILVPIFMGGCPEVRNEAVDAFETATLQVLDSAVAQVFDVFRDSNTR